MKRLWLLGHRFGFITQGELFSDYFRSNLIRVLYVAVALMFAVPYVGLQLRAAGYLFNILSDGLMPIEIGMWLLAQPIALRVSPGLSTDLPP